MNGMPSGSFYGAKASPQTPQKLVPAAEYLPQFLQRAGLTMTAEDWFMATCVGAAFVRAQISAIIQPTPLQPITKLSQKISLAFPLFRPMIAGRKYKIRHDAMMRNPVTDIVEKSLIGSFLGLFSYGRRAARYAAKRDGCL
jgi:hypothetical protein